MKLSPRPGLLVVSLGLAGVLAAGVASADPPPPEPVRSVYRIEVSVTGLEENPRAAPATYVVDLLENQPGTVASGANIPLAAPVGGTAAPRQDVGLTMHVSYALRGAVVLLTGGFEMSSGDPPGAQGSGTATTIHRVRIEGVTPVTPGTPAVFGSVYDITSHRRYEVTVSARRLL